jgi:glycosyltransferase involved in cell wall biosynthesis
MKIVLATGIYPPDIGGPATYVENLARELTRQGTETVVLTYGPGQGTSDAWPVVSVPKSGGPLLRWFRYARALKKHASDADAVLCFSSVSTGLPLRFAGLRKPKKILRLGGDFFWERYAALGGTRSLKEWYAHAHHRHSILDFLAYAVTRFFHRLTIPDILHHFHELVFSTHFQEEIYVRGFRRLPPHAVIENALPAQLPLSQPMHLLRADSLRGRTFRLLYLGRFVGFKNLPSLLRAVRELPHTTITFVGDGPMKRRLQRLAEKLHIESRVHFVPSVHNLEKKQLLTEFDLLVLPSITEISPNAALEARAMGLPVLLTSETGLSDELTRGMVLRDTEQPSDIVRALLEVEQKYEHVANEASTPIAARSWQDVADEWMALFQRLA